MVFSSPIFLFFFLPAVLFLHFLLGRHLRNIVLLAASLFFYTWGEKEYVVLILVSFVLNYFIALGIDRAYAAGEGEKVRRQAKILLILAVVTNLGFLFVFKYANFSVHNFNVLLGLAKIPAAIRLLPVHLPLGISFFTFHKLSYVIDVYRKTASCKKSPTEAALYFFFFPQLVAGPIIRYHDIVDQLHRRTIGFEKFASGARRFVTGLAKKVLIANTLGAVVDKIFLIKPSQLTFQLSWLGIVFYALQIYFDFSGYSDMAIGLGRMFGFEFLENFNYPYIARSVRDFWRRWHISLTNWFRDYLYIPLGGSREGTAATWRNLLIVFFLCGFWHGASWTFVVWGLFHGFFLILERTKFGRLLDKWGGVPGHIYTIFVVLVGWVFFRSETISYAGHYLAAMFGFARGNGIEFYPALYLSNDVILALVFGIVGATPVIRLLRRVGEIRFVGPTAEILALSALFIASAMQLAAGTYNPLIYFRF